MTVSFDHPYDVCQLYDCEVFVLLSIFIYLLLFVRYKNCKLLFLCDAGAAK